MKELTQDQCIEIRKKILYEFHSLCQKENIRYSLGYGTLLGAIRHRGMIPWDDDIDVIVSRADFEKLNILYKTSACKDRYQFVSHRNHPEIKTKIAYFIDYDTITETAFKTNDYHGVHIDIYPVDIVPNEWFKRIIVLIRRWCLHKLIKAKDIHPEVMKGIHKTIRRIVLLLCAPFDYDKTLDKLQDISRHFMNVPEIERKMACIYVESGKALYFPYKITKDFELYNYENNLYWGYKDYDAILKIWYGDYMTPPPKEEQKRPEHRYVHFYYKDSAL